MPTTGISPPSKMLQDLRTTNQPTCQCSTWTIRTQLHLTLTMLASVQAAACFLLAVTVTLRTTREPPWTMLICKECLITMLERTSTTSTSTIREDGAASPTGRLKDSDQHFGDMEHTFRDQAIQKGETERFFCVPFAVLTNTYDGNAREALTLDLTMDPSTTLDPPMLLPLPIRIDLTCMIVDPWQESNNPISHAGMALWV